MHNSTFKDINSRPIISSIKFHISFSPAIIIYIFPFTDNNNSNKTRLKSNNRNIKPGTLSFFSPQFFIRLKYHPTCHFCFFVMLCPNENQLRTFYFYHFFRGKMSWLFLFPFFIILFCHVIYCSFCFLDLFSL